MSHPHILCLALLLCCSSILRAQGRDSIAADSSGLKSDSSPFCLTVIAEAGRTLESGGTDYYGFGTRFGDTILPLENHAEGVGFSVGVGVTYDYGRSTRIMASLSLSRYPGRYEGDIHGVTGGIVDSTTLRMTTDITTLNFSLIPSYRLFSIGSVPINLSAGFVLQGVLSATEERSVEAPESWKDSAFLPIGWLPEASEESEIEEASSILLSLQSGLGPDIAIGENLRISPALIARFSAGSLVPRSRWRLGMFGGSLDISWRL